MKKILYSAASIVFIGVLAYSATGAFFSDTETSTGNVFAAGDIDLQIDNESYVTNTAGTLVASQNNSWSISDLTNQLFFSFADVKPGDIGEDTISIHVGSNDAYACMAADITATPENTLVDPETDAGDAGPALGDNGELQNYLNFVFWNDDGDNVYETGESQITQLVGPASSIFNGAWAPIGTTSVLMGNTTNYVAKAWCVGGLTPNPLSQDGLGKTGSNGPLVRGTGFTCSGVGNQNDAQTDGITMDVSFYAVQARNNNQFSCSSLPPFVGESDEEELVVEVNQNDLGVEGWFFYNDTNDTVMTIDQFAAQNGQNHMDSVAGEEGAKMTLDTNPNPRYNIATAQFGGTLLNTISALNFRVYDATADGDTPFLQFNVDFATSTVGAGYQGRLTMQPGSSTNPPLAAATWTTVDAINGGNAMWTWSKFAVGPDLIAATADDNRWPDGNTNQYRSWNSIITSIPTAKLLTPGTFFGVRTGQPGPAGATNFVSSINFDGTTYNFEI
jgi:predicted ribosomally synthesized peptide with SipW-like signal peptide